MIDWNQLIRDGKISESPGKAEASQMLFFKATFREKSGAEHSETIAAMSYHGALRKLKGRSKTLISLKKIHEPINS